MHAGQSHETDANKATASLNKEMCDVQRARSHMPPDSKKDANRGIRVHHTNV